MAITSYAELQTSVASFLARSDLTGVIPDFITMFEARAKRELREWLTFTVTATNLTTDYTLPATVSDVLGVWHNDGPSGANNRPLHMITGEEYHLWMESDSTAGGPVDLVYVDYDADAPATVLRFYRPASVTGPLANLKVEAVKVLPALSASQTTNALLREAPDLYLFGSCAEAAKYLQHDERVALWSADRDAGFRNLRVLSERRRYGALPRARLARTVF